MGHMEKPLRCRSILQPLLMQISIIVLDIVIWTEFSKINRLIFRNLFFLLFVWSHPMMSIIPLVSNDVEGCWILFVI